MFSYSTFFSKVVHIFCLLSVRPDSDSEKDQIPFNSIIKN